MKWGSVFIALGIAAGNLLPQAASGNAKDVKSLYPELANLRPEDRVIKSTENFVGQPTGLDPLGDGEGVDPKPISSFKKFDCTTYVETNLAIAFSKSEADVVPELTKIRYAGERPDYFQRNHFMVTDWIPANSKKGFVTEITAGLAADKAAYRLDKKTLNKTVWFYHRVIDLMAEQKKNPAEILKELAKVPLIPIKEEKTSYLQASYFREHETEVAQRMPDASIVMFIRNIPAVPTLVNHMGFVIKKDGKLWLNHAPQAKPWAVQQVPLDDYLEDMDSHRAPVDGLLFLKIGGNSRM